MIFKYQCKNASLFFKTILDMRLNYVRNFSNIYQSRTTTKMANRTVKDAHSVKGTNPQYLVEKIIRTRIYECRYWKEECFALTGNDSK